MRQMNQKECNPYTNETADIRSVLFSKTYQKGLMVSESTYYDFMYKCVLAFFLSIYTHFLCIKYN